MRVVLVMSDASLWKPAFARNLISRLPESGNQVVGAVLTGFRPKGVSKLEHFRRYFTILGLWPFILMSARSAFHAAADILDRVVRVPGLHSIAGVCRRNGIPTLTTKDANRPEVVEWIRHLKTDVLLSSGHLIFRKPLLAAANVACINRHSSLLPSYAGIYPIFWCLLNGEDEVGVTVHTMTEKIDKGVILSQKSVAVRPGDTFFSLFGKCFELSVDAVLEALRKLEEGAPSPVESNRKRSYFSYPTKEDARLFRARGNRML